jgi:ketosteroid isomerase-like protein
MKSKVLQGVFFIYVLIMISACNTKTTETASVVVDTAQIKQEIQARENEFAEMYNSGEFKNIGYYADDAISYSQNRPPLVGKEAIVNYYMEGKNTFNKTNRITFTTNEVFVYNGGVHVVEIGSYTVVDSSNTAINSGNYMVLFEKRNGKYSSIRDMSTSDRPMDE